MKLYVIDLPNAFGYYGNKKINDRELEQLREIIHDQNNYVLLVAIMEFWHSALINSALEALCIHHNQTNVVLLVEECKYYNTADMPINFTNVRYYNNTLIQNHSLANDDNNIVDLDTNKFLFIVGKSYKEHRIKLLYKLYTSQLLNYCDWSFRLSNPDITRSLIQNISDEEYDTFVNRVTHELDDFSSMFGKSSSGIVAEKELYRKTSFSLLSETHCSIQYSKFITEKTWRAISNRHLFVHISYVDNINFLEELGFDTFQYIMPNKKEQYTADKSIDELVEFTTENITFVLENINRYKNEVVSSITHNYHILQDRVSHFRDIIDLSIEPIVAKPYFLKGNAVDLIEGSDAEKAIKKLWC